MFAHIFACIFVQVYFLKNSFYTAWKSKNFNILDEDGNPVGDGTKLAYHFANIILLIVVATSCIDKVKVVRNIHK